MPASILFIVQLPVVGEKTVAVLNFTASLKFRRENVKKRTTAGFGGQYRAYRRSSAFPGQRSPPAMTKT
jgi:hypothetical protein